MDRIDSLGLFDDAVCVCVCVCVCACVRVHVCVCELHFHQQTSSTLLNWGLSPWHSVSLVHSKSPARTHACTLTHTHTHTRTHAHTEFQCTSTLEGDENEVKCSSWSRSGSLLTTCSRDMSVWIWEGESEMQVVSWQVDSKHIPPVRY